VVDVVVSYMLPRLWNQWRGLSRGRCSVWRRGVRVDMD
jgi:hypothetical protein